MTELCNVNEYHKNLNFIIIYTVVSLPPFFLSLDFLSPVAPFFVETQEEHCTHCQGFQRPPCGGPFQSHENCVFLSHALVLYQFGLFMTFGGHVFPTEQAGCDVWLYVRNAVSFKSFICFTSLKQPNEEIFLVILRHLKCGLKGRHCWLCR